MSRPEFGTKCVCTSCAARFYDLNRLPAVCPKCEAAQPPAVLRAPRPTFTSARMTRRPRPAVAEEEAEPLPAAEDDEDHDTEADDDDDAGAEADVPEIEADTDAGVDPAIVRD